MLRADILCRIFLKIKGGELTRFFSGGGAKFGEEPRTSLTNVLGAKQIVEHLLGAKKFNAQFVRGRSSYWVKSLAHHFLEANIFDAYFLGAKTCNVKLVRHVMPKW